MRKHPSGRPIRRHAVKDPRPITREPYRESLIPGLRKPDTFTQAIGFHTDSIPYQEPDDDGEEDAGAGARARRAHGARD